MSWLFRLTRASAVSERAPLSGARRSSPQRAGFRLVGHGARESALSAAGLAKGPLSGAWAPGGHGAQSEPPGQEARRDGILGFAAVPDFPEVPAGLLNESRWGPRLWGTWKFREDILILEARALGPGVRRFALNPPGCHCRSLMLSDNMSIVLAFARSRPREFRLLIHIRRSVAYSLARNVAIFFSGGSRVN